MMREEKGGFDNDGFENTVSLELPGVTLMLYLPFSLSSRGPPLQDLSTNYATLKTNLTPIRSTHHFVSARMMKDPIHGQRTREEQGRNMRRRR